MRLTTGRRLESYNTGVQTGRFSSPLHRGESLDLSPEDAAALGVVEGEIGADRVATRRHRGARPRTTASRGAGVHDVPLPRRGRDERDHDRGLRPEVGHRRSSRPRRSASRSSRSAREGSLPRRGPEADDGGADRRGTRSGRRGARRAETGWDGGERTVRDLRVSHAPEDDRTSLLPVLHALQGRIGWISEGGLNYACERLSVPPAEAYGVATFYAMFSVQARRRRCCMSATTRCRVRGGDAWPSVSTAACGGDPKVVRSPCLGLCDAAPAVLFQEAGEGAVSRAVAPADADRSARFAARRARARAAPGAGAASRRRATPASSGVGRPHIAARLPGARRVRRVGARDRARPRRRHPAGDRRAPARSWGRGVPDRSEVAGGGRPAARAEVRRVQRRRIRAGHLQGPRADGERSVRDHRGAHDRRARDRRGDGLPLHPRRVPARDETPAGSDRGGAGRRAPRAGRDARRVRLRHRAPSWRGRLHLRRGDRAVQLDRGQARRATEQAAVPRDPRRLRTPDRDQQRGDAGQRAPGVGAGRRRVRRARDGGLDGHATVLPVGPRRAPRCLRGRTRHHPRRGDRDGRRRARRRPDQGGAARRRGGRVPRAGSTSTSD